MKEQYYQKKIIDFLRSRGCFVSKYHATGYGMKGHPDLIVSIPHYPFPICVYIEVKTPVGRLSTEQKIVHKLLEDAGHIVIVAVTVGDVKQSLESIGIYL